MVTFALVILGSVGCRNAQVVDEDGDGIEAAFDCDDGNAAIGPDIAEVCDGIDNDCDGQIDEGVGLRSWPDTDGDSYGDGSAASVTQCEDGVPGFATRAGDCDDSDDTVFPGAPEDCSDVDRNCDGRIHLGAPGLTWYADGDGDGYGRADATREACEAPANFAAVPGDCDDTVATVNPGADELCNDVDDDCNDQIDDAPIDMVTLYEDQDADGFGIEDVTTIACPGEVGWAEAFGDCNDADATVAPDQVDVCNAGIDDDCDPTTDENAVSGTPWVVDADTDGFGASGSALLACTSPGGEYIADPGPVDCNDADDTVNPGAPETCNDVDDDCDGTTDEAATDATAYFADGDGDGFGDPTTEVRSCDPVDGRVTNADDCDDTTAAISPDTPEACDGGIDNDCDPSTTDDDAPDAPVWYADLDRDFWGDPTAPIVACVQPTLTTAPEAAFDCDDTTAAINPYRAEICNGGIDDDCDPTTDEEDNFTWYADFDGDGFGDPDVNTNSCTQPPDFVADATDCDDQATELNPTDTPGCIQDHCGTITQSEIWRASVEHVVSCDVRVEGAAKPTLTVQAGTVVRFDPRTELRVGQSDDGRILVQGDTADITFTSSEAVPLPGDWDGLNIGANDQGSSIEGLIVEYAGNNGVGGVRLNAGDVPVRRLVSRYNIHDGLHVDAGEPLVVDSVFEGNSGNGVTIESSAGLSRVDADGASGPSFAGNVIVDNLERPIVLPGSVADELDTSSSFTGNAIDEIELLTGTLRFTGIWANHGVPYAVRAGANIDIEDGPQAELTIADGVTMVFGSGAGLRVGWNAEGRLVVDGHTDGVVMTGSAEVIAQSDSWDGLTFGVDDAGSEVLGLTIEYGGDNGVGNLYVRDASPVFSNVVSRFSDGDGLYVTGGDAAPTVTGSTFSDNDENGVFLNTTSDFAFGSTFSDNLLTGNGAAPIVLPPEALGALDASSSFAGNGSPIHVHPGDVVTDGTWPFVDETYEFLGSVEIGGPQDPVVTIEDGVNMTFAANARLSVGTSDDGTLLVDGDVLGVVMDSAAVVKGEGDWQGIRVGTNQSGLQTALRGLTIAYAGGSDTGDGGALELTDRDGCSSQELLIDLDDLVITNSSKSAIYAQNWTTFSLDGATMTDNLGSCVYVGTSNSCSGPTIASFTNNVCTGSPVFGRWPLSEVDALDATSTYPGPIVFESTSLRDDVTLKNLGVPYHFLNSLTVGDATDAVLTVQSGNTLRFDLGVALNVGTSTDGGVVFEAGTPETVLTSLATSPAAGDWDGLKVGRFCSTVNIEDVVVEYAGDNGTGALWFDRCNAGGDVDGVSIEQSSTCGLYYDPTASTMTLGTVSYLDNGTDACP